jgi:hypothetical protein
MEALNEPLKNSNGQRTVFLLGLYVLLTPFLVVAAHRSPFVCAAHVVVVVAFLGAKET